MKITSKNLKIGSITVQLKTLDDVWTLYRIIQPQDKVSGFTQRKIKVGDSTTQKSSAVSIKNMILTITVEKTSYENEGKTLRILGPILEGNEYVSAGEYHSFTLEEESIITIIKKEWPQYHIRMIEESTQDSKGSTIIVAFDRQCATLGTISSRGFNKNTYIEGNVQKKGADGTTATTNKSTSFYQELVAQITALDNRIKPTTIILASSNFWKDPLFNQIDTQAKELRKKTKWIECDDVSQNAIGELVKSTEFQKLILAQSQTTIYNTFEEILRRIAKDLPATYGLEEVRKATQQSAIHTALISTKLIQQHRDKQTFEELENTLKEIENTGATIHIVGDEFTIYDKLNGLGGIVALLRFKIE